MKNLSRILLSLALLPFTLLGGIDWSKVELENPGYFVQGEITVRFRDGVDLDNIKTTLNSPGTQEVGRIPQLNLVHLRLPSGMDVRSALRLYEVRPDVLYVEPVAILRAFWTPDDEFFSYQWNFDSQHLNMPAAWDKQKGSSGVTVAIIDTGVAFEDYSIPSHESGEVTSSDGYYHICPDLSSSQFVSGYDFVHDDSHPNDQQGHGTHVSGTVAQATNNGTGTAGMAPNCKLMPVQVLDYSGSGNSDDLTEGIIWAADHGADVINMSLGWPSANDSVGLSSVHEAIIYAQNKGVVIVAAAGNEGVGKPSYPGAFEECICVAALDYNNELAPYSQYGPGIDISAPGGNTYADENNDGYADGILQCTYTYPGDEYGGAKVDEFEYPFWDGTSMATPHVAGLAALIISNGVTGVSNVKQRIFSTATDLGSSGYDTYYGYGMINPVAALGSGGTDTSKIEIPVLQNPLLSQYIDIWVIPTSGNLSNEPDVTVTLNGNEETVYMESVSGSAGYRGDYEFAESGAATIEVTAGGSSKTRTFTVGEIGVAGGILASADNKITLDIPQDAFQASAFVTIMPEMTSETPSNPFRINPMVDARAIGCAYRIGPACDLRSPVSLRISYTGEDLQGDDPSTFVIMKFSDGAWTKVPSFVERRSGEIVAFVTSLGIYQLAQDVSQSSPDLPRMLEFELAGSNPVVKGSNLILRLDKPTDLALAIFDASGRKVRRLAEGSFSVGVYEFRLDAEDDTGGRLAPGVYFARLTSVHTCQTLKITVLH